MLTYATATAGTATCTLPTKTASGCFLVGILWSYSTAASLPANATPGTVNITIGGTVVASFDVTSPGAGFIPFGETCPIPAGVASTVTLLSGGTAVVGKLTAFTR